MPVKTISVQHPDVGSSGVHPPTLCGFTQWPGTGVILQLAAEILAESLDLRSTQRVLDVAAGSGNFTVAAARRWADITAVDSHLDCLREAEARTRTLCLNAEFEPADARRLPFASGSFDVVASTFGVMYSSNPDQSAAELRRVAGDDGKIGLNCWTPDGFMGQLLDIIDTYVPLPEGQASAVRWGTRSGIESLFRSQIRQIGFRDRNLVFRFRSADHWLSLYHRAYGPLHDAFSRLGTPGVSRLTRDLLRLVERFNVSGDSTMVVPSSYLECVIHKG